MKTISPVNIWHEGTLKEATLLEAFSSYDDLKSYATLSYRIMQAPAAPEGPDPMMAPVMMNNIIATGSIYMGGQDYIDWDNSNEQAYDYIAEKLNLTIVPDPAP